MNRINLMKKLERMPVFRVQDIERICRCERAYARVILNRLKEKRLIKRVAENVYTTKDHIFVIASNIIYPCYISFWSASYFLGYTEQIVNTIQVAVTLRKKSIEFENYRIKFIKLEEFFGYKKIKTEEGNIFLVEDEKLLIDVFLRPNACGNFGEIEKIYENAKVNKEKIVKYLKRVNRQTVIKRVGYLLEKTKDMDISDKLELDRNYVVLNPFSREWKKINSKWRVKI
jgi:predicted transcriptional regulator of viral defense system